MTFKAKLPAISAFFSFAMLVLASVVLLPLDAIAAEFRFFHRAM